MAIRKLTNINLSTILSSGNMIPYDQPEIETVMKKLLYDSGVTDVLYEGSNISQLTSVISYAIASLNINTAINLQETILPLATKRANVLFGARQLGYEPHHQKSYKYKIILRPMYDQSKIIPRMMTDPTNSSKQIVNPRAGEIDINNQVSRIIPLHQNTRFESGNDVYYYRGPDIKSIFELSNWDINNQILAAQEAQDNQVSGAIISNNYTKQHDDLFRYEIIIEEGELISFEDQEDREGDPTLEWVVKEYTDEDGIVRAQQDFIIPHHGVEDDGLQVFVKSIDYNKPPIGGVYQYEKIQRYKSGHFLIDKSYNQENDKFIRMENIILRYPTIFFEYSGMGNPVKSGDVVQVNVFKTKGTKGAASERFSVENTVASQMFYVEKEFTLERRGEEAESDNSIKTNAMVYNNTASRAVTKLDYITITSGLPNVQDADAWGGEDERPRQLGHIWVSTTPHYGQYFNYIPPVKYAPARPAYGNQGDSDYEPALPVVHKRREEYNCEVGTPVPGMKDKEGVPINLDNWYQTELSTPEIFDKLDFYKIITMRLHHRQPVYVEFNYLVDVVKYDMSESVTGINAKVFEGIQKYFEEIQKFDVDYINSNLQRILDIILTYQSGLGFTLVTEGVLHKGMTTEFQQDNPKVESTPIKFVLAYPFEDMFQKFYITAGQPDAPGYLDTTLLPKIDTTYFGNARKILKVDLNTMHGTTDINGYFHKGEGEVWFDIKYNNSNIGKYIVNNDRSEIEIELSFGSKINEVFNSGNSYAKFNLTYPYNTEYTHNIPFTRNLIPRLNKVIFKDN